MMNKVLPANLKLLVFMWFVFGLVALIATITSIFEFRSSSVSFYLNLLGFWIANGLVKLRPEWRTRALAVSYINIIAWSIFILVTVFHREAWASWWIPVVVLETGAMVWGISILRRADISELFDDVTTAEQIVGPERG